MFSLSKRGPLDSFVKKMVCPAGWAGQLTDAIVGMLDLRPAAIVERVGYHRLMQVADTGNYPRIFFRCTFTVNFISSIHLHQSHTKHIKYLDSDSDSGGRFEKVQIREVLDSFHPN